MCGNALCFVGSIIAALTNTIVYLDCKPDISESLFRSSNYRGDGGRRLIIFAHRANIGRLMKGTERQK